MEYQSSEFLIKWWREARMLMSIPSKESTLGCVQKEILQNSHSWRPRICEWLRMGRSVFPQPKAKSYLVRFLSNLWHLNRKLKRKPYPMTKICEMILKPEGFKYAMSMDFNMGYYHMHLSEEASNLCIIIRPWGEYSYKLLTMRVRTSLGTFQEKMNKMFHIFWIYLGIYSWPVDNH